MASNISSFCSSQLKASALTIVSLGESSESWLRPRSSGSGGKRRATGGASATSRKRRVDQRFVVAVLVARMELQVAIEKEADAGAAGRDDDALVRARGAVDHMVGIEVILGPRRHMVGEDERATKRGDGRGAGDRVPAQPTQLAAKQPERPDRDAGVHQAEEGPRADEAEVRHQQQGKGDRDGESAEIVEGEDL